ncbi:MAG: DUF4956 domain-containing protein [Clostridiales bacterium]|jgi:hypothetical protein|nr:DUF4956 domain-containing protein [Clostridiales bacterium]
MFESIILNDGLTVSNAAICTAVSLGLGLLLAAVCLIKNKPTKNFVITLILIPALVQAIIMMVNGNIGTGVAVVGAFSLVRFRSYPGTSKDIAFIFFAMALGIATGIGQVWFALVFAAIICVIYTAAVLLSGIPFLKNILFSPKKENEEKDLKITFPEDYEFESEMATLLKSYTTAFELVRVKTSNMGSLYTASYSVTLKPDTSIKQLIDEIRIRNSNLPIVCVSRKAKTEEDDVL